MPTFLDFPTTGSVGAPSSSWDGLTFRLAGNPNQESGGLDFTLDSDGTWQCPVPRTIGVESGNWFTPTTVGIGSSYEARFTPSSAPGDPDVFNEAEDWTTLGSGLVFSYSLTGSFVSGNNTVLVEIRDATSHVVVVSGSFLMSILLP